MEDQTLYRCVDATHGVYVPQVFFTYMDNLDFVNFKELEEDIDIIKNGGTDHEYYWDAWFNILDNALLKGKNGKFYRLYQDGDLFIYEVEV